MEPRRHGGKREDITKHRNLVDNLVASALNIKILKLKAPALYHAPLPHSTPPPQASHRYTVSC